MTASVDTAHRFAMIEPCSIFCSNKAGLNCKDSYVVARGKTSFLRILGCDPVWNVMTATASEDYGDIQVCTDQRRLIEAALRLGAELKTKPTVEKDRLSREYVKIFSITRGPGENDASVIADIQELSNKLLAYYDGYRELGN